MRNNSEVSALIQQLETYYDRTYSAPPESEEEEEAISLAPGVEQFLYEVGGRLEEPSEEEGDYDEDIDDDEDIDEGHDNN